MLRRCRNGHYRRSAKKRELTHIRVAIEEALDFLQPPAESCAERHGPLEGPVMARQPHCGCAIDSLATRREEPCRPDPSRSGGPHGAFERQP